MTQPRDFSLYGAVDLGARQAAAQRREQAAKAAESGTASDAVIEVTEETFNTDVVARSRTTPVIVDLWAEWCGPCKQLGPVLERLAEESNGSWILAKVDVDANPQLAQALQVQSIPMVIAVVGGQLVDAFLGAIPEAQVKQWIGQVLEVAQQLGVGTEGAPADQAEQPANGRGSVADETAAGRDAAPGGRQGAAGPGPRGGAEEMPPAFAEASAAMDRGDFDGAVSVLEKHLAASPADPVAKSWLAQANLMRRVSSFDETTARSDAAARPDDIDAQLNVADLDLRSGRATEAFDRLLGVVRRTSGDDRDRARAHLVSLFEIFPPGDREVSKARGTLSSLLF
jgi:putative thioredoxin